MKNKSKPCKGTGSAKGWGCGELQVSRTYGLGSSFNGCRCYFDWLASDDGAYKRKKLAIKAKKDVKKDSAKEKKDQLNYKELLQVKVQEIARLIDFGLPCLARDQFGKMNGGHVFSKGGNAQMRFNLHNIHRQCSQSNMFNNDDGLFREKLSLEYGSSYLEFLLSLRAFPVPKHSKIEYREIYKRALKIANNLSKNKRIRSVEHRLSMRNAVNKELAIYLEPQNIFNKY